MIKDIVALSGDPPHEYATELRIGLRSEPYLADHGFQNMVVLPGSFYVQAALWLDRELSKRVVGHLRSVSFQNPVILSTEDTVIKVEVKDHGEGRVEYAFYEEGVVNGSATHSNRQCTATLEIDRNQLTPQRARTDNFSIEAFQARAHTLIDSEQFYKRLLENGNQYGPSFQHVSTIWRMGDQSLGKLSVAPEHRGGEPYCPHPSLLDSMTQLLAPFAMEKGKTFILRSIERIELTNINFPDTLWAHATLLSQDDSDANCILGNVRVFDLSGETYLELSGVAFTLLDGIDIADEKPTASLVIASNFTAEPLEDTLNFWGNHFGVQMYIEFAPYNQIFQQLLDTGSGFSRNSGVCAILS